MTLEESSFAKKIDHRTWCFTHSGPMPCEACDEPCELCGGLGRMLGYDGKPCFACKGSGLDGTCGKLWKYARAAE